MARETGLEPATSGVTGRRSNQLSYSRSGGGSSLPRNVGVVYRPPRVKSSDQIQNAATFSRNLHRLWKSHVETAASVSFLMWNVRITPASISHRQLTKNAITWHHCVGADGTGGEWWAMTGSNRRHLRCKRSALPTELIARVDQVDRCKLALIKGPARQRQPPNAQEMKRPRRKALGANQDVSQND